MTSEISELDLDDFTERTGWLYRRSVPSGGFDWIHLPLVYTTRCGLELEAYAVALSRFPALCGISGIAPILRHGVVVGLAEGASARLARQAFDRLDDRPWIDRWLDRVTRARNELAGVCLELEPPLLEGHLPSTVALRQSREVLSEAIAVGLLGPLVEAHRLFGDHAGDLPSPTFSWVRWFDEHRAALESAAKQGELSPGEVADEVAVFVWQAGFLGRTRQDRERFGDPEALARSLGLTTAPILTPELAASPAFPAPPEGPGASDVRTLHSYLLQALGDLEEIRHYWQARLARNWRLVADRVGLPESVGLVELTSVVSRSVISRSVVSRTEPPRPSTPSPVSRVWEKRKSGSSRAPQGATLHNLGREPQAVLEAEPGRFPKVEGLQRLESLGLATPALVVIPPEVCARVDSEDSADFEQALDDASRRLGPAPEGVSVRSASSLEDGEGSAMAGRFESFNGLSERSAIHRAALHVVWQHRDEVGERPLALMLQPTFPCWMAGVTFLQRDSEDDTHEDPAHVVIEATWGSCRNIVDGGVDPYRSSLASGPGPGAWRHSWQDDDPGETTGPTAEIYRVAAGCFEPCESLDEGVRLRPRSRPFVVGPRLLLPPATHEWVVYGDRPSRPPAWYEERVCGVFETLAREHPELRGVDLEWGADAEGRLVFFQLRPTTARVQATDLDPGTPSDTGWSGLPASPGQVRGTVVAPTAIPDLHRRDAVVMLDQVSEIEYRDLRRCGAVVASTGGVLSHVAILCRELGIPCVTGLGNTLEPGLRVLVDGTTGRIVLDTTESAGALEAMEVA